MTNSECISQDCQEMMTVDIGDAQMSKWETDKLPGQLQNCVMRATRGIGLACAGGSCEAKGSSGRGSRSGAMVGVESGR